MGLLTIWGDIGERGGGEGGRGPNEVENGELSCSLANDLVIFSIWVSFRDAPCAYGLTRLVTVCSVLCFWGSSDM